MLGAFRINQLAKIISQPPITFTFVTSSVIVNTTGTSTASYTVNAGDLVVIWVTATASIGSSSAPPVQSLPAGFTGAVNIASPTQVAAQRTSVFYQIATTTGARTTSSYTGSTGSAHTVIAYRPSRAITSIAIGNGAHNITTATPTNASLVFETNMTSALAFGYGASSGTNSTLNSVLNSTVAPTRYVANPASTAYARVACFEGAGFSGSTTLSRVDSGTNTLGYVNLIAS
jgi:hypothetical protein